MKAELIAEILDRGRDDWVDFAEVMSVVRSRTTLAEPAAIAMSIEIIGDMLNQHTVVVGDLQKRGDKVLFSPWDGQPTQIVARIQSDLAALGHRPGIGEVCWLSTT
jgi:hypothetical protein